MYLNHNHLPFLGCWGLGAINFPPPLSVDSFFLSLFFPNQLLSPLVFLDYSFFSSFFYTSFDWSSSVLFFMFHASDDFFGFVSSSSSLSSNCWYGLNLLPIVKAVVPVFFSGLYYFFYSVFSVSVFLAHFPSSSSFFSSFLNNPFSSVFSPFYPAFAPPLKFQN